MTYEEALAKKIKSDWKIVGRLCGLTSEHASIISTRPNAKKYTKIMDTLVAVVEAREKLFGDFQLKS